MIPTFTTEARWTCPACDAQLVTPTVPDRPILHPCRGMKGLSVPMVRAGSDCKLEAHERDDYIGSDLVRTDGEGRPIMNVTTTYADGHSDCTVYAPTGVFSRKEM